MAYKCRIKRKDMGSAPSGADLMLFATKKILPSLIKIYNNKNYYNDGIISPTKIKKAVISFFKSLGKDYYPAEYEYIEQAVNQLLQLPKMAFFKNIVDLYLYILYNKNITNYMITFLHYELQINLKLIL